MTDATEGLELLVELLNFDCKKELERYCKSKTITEDDLYIFIALAKNGIFPPYKYTSHFERNIPEHLFPTEEQRKAFEENGVGPFRSKDARKLASKLSNTPKEMKSIAAHLLYTSDHQYWHIFYFTNRDQDTRKNHWKNGPHLHYVSSLWGNLKLDEAWGQVLSGMIKLKALHIKYRK